MHFLKLLISPIIIVIFFLTIGFMLTFSKRKELLAKIFIFVSFSILLLFSFRPFANFLVWGLEQNYAPLFKFDNLASTEYLVVLTSWDSNNQSVPYTSNIGYQSAFRVLEAHRIHTQLPNSGVILSGSEIGTNLMKKLIVFLGVPENKIITETNSKNTWESAENVKNIVGKRQFILITNAIHLPRAMLAFTQYGLNPIPGPADFYYGYYQKFPNLFHKHLSYYMPNLESFILSTRALHEYTGIFWYFIKSFF